MTIATLQDLHDAFSDYVGEKNPPAKTNTAYIKRTRYFNRGRDDIAKRHFYKSLLRHATLNITAGDATYALPDDFERPNGLYVLSNSSGSVVFTNPFARDAAFQISRVMATGKYEITFLTPPPANDTYPYWYFATPPKLVEDTDPVLVDGEATLQFGLKQHFFIDGDLDLYQECRDEYENIVEEQQRQLDIPPPGALLGMQNVAVARRGTTSERAFYGGRRNRTH